MWTLIRAVESGSTLSVKTNLSKIFMALSLIFYSTNIHNWGQELQRALGVNWTLVEAGITRGCGELANTCSWRQVL